MDDEMPFTSHVSSPDVDGDVTEGEPPAVSPDETFARELHAWLATKPPSIHKRLRGSVEAWLGAKGL